MFHLDTSGHSCWGLASRWDGSVYEHSCKWLGHGSGLNETRHFRLTRANHTLTRQHITVPRRIRRWKPSYQAQSSVTFEVINTREKIPGTNPRTAQASFCITSRAYAPFASYQRHKNKSRRTASLQTVRTDLRKWLPSYTCMVWRTEVLVFSNMPTSWE